MDNYPAIVDSKEDAKVLSQRLDIFCQMVVSGLSYSMAYRNAYDCQDLSKWDIYARAAQIAKLPAVKERIKYFETHLSEANLWSKEKSALTLIRVINSGADDKNIIAAVKELNSMYGYSAPKKLALTGKDETDLVPTVQFYLPHNGRDSNN